MTLRTDNTARVTRQPEGQPLLESVEFWLIFYADLKWNSREFYENYIKRITTELDVKGNLDEFLNTDNSAREFLKKINFIKKFNGIYWQVAITPELEARHTKGRENVIDGIGNNRRDKDDTVAKYEVFQNFKNTVLQSSDLDLQYLFGIYLPPRRLEMYQVYVSRDESKYENTYNPDTAEFVLKDYKGIGRSKKKNPDFRWNLADFTFLPEVTLAHLKGKLAGLPEDKLLVDFGKNVSRKVSSVFGMSNDLIRGYWATAGKTVFETPQYVRLCRWMGHSLDCSVKQYTL